MAGLMRIAEHVVIDRLVSNGPPLAGKSKIGMAVTAMSGLLFAVGLGFFIYAAYLWLGNLYAADVATLYTSLLTFALSALLMAGVYIAVQLRKQKMKKMKQEVADSIIHTLNEADNELARSVRENPKSAMMVSTLAGFLVGERLL